jgi:hypothetical protein
LNREPDNKSALEMLDKLAGQDPNGAYISTLEVEGRINTFFRLTSPTVIAKLREAFPDLPEKPDQRTVFLKPPRTAQHLVNHASITVSNRPRSSHTSAGNIPAWNCRMLPGRRAFSNNASLQFDHRMYIGR